MSESRNYKRFYKYRRVYSNGAGLKYRYRYEDDYCEEKFLSLANEAWIEVLKEKIKAEIDKTQGESLVKLAKIISNTHAEKWKHKTLINLKCEEYKDILKEFFASKY